MVFYFINFIIYFFQELFLGGCILSRLQFSQEKKSRVRFFSYYFKKFGWSFDSHKVDIFFVWLMPVLIFILAFFLQRADIVKPLFNI